MNPNLAAVLSRARAAVTACTSNTAPTAPATDSATTSRPTTPAAPTVRVSVPAPAPAAPSRPACEPVAALRDGLPLTVGAVRLHDALHRLARDVLHERGHRAVPDSVTFHLPVALIAGWLEYTERHVYRLADELQAHGLIQSGGHAQKVGGRALWDGTLWAVRMKSSAAPARIRADEWRHMWRPAFLADYRTKCGAKWLMSQLLAKQVGPEGMYDRVLRCAVDPGSVSQPVVSSPDMSGEPAPAREILYTLPSLADAHPDARNMLITRNARALAFTLRDMGSVAFYAGLMHRAVTAEYRGLNTLHALQNAIQRVLVDVQEWPDLKRPGALLVRRLKEAGVYDVLTA